MKKCPYCAEKIQDEAIFCRYCGHNIIIKPEPLIIEIKDPSIGKRRFVKVTLKKGNWDTIINILESDHRFKESEWIEWGDFVKGTIQSRTDRVASLDNPVSVVLSEESWTTINSFIDLYCQNKSKDWRTWAEQTTQVIQKSIDSTKFEFKPKEPSRQIRNNKSGQSVWATGAKIAAVLTVLAAIVPIARYRNAPAELIGSLTIGAVANFFFWWLVCSFFIWSYRKVMKK